MHAVFNAWGFVQTFTKLPTSFWVGKRNSPDLNLRYWTITYQWYARSTKSKPGVYERYDTVWSCERNVFYLRTSSVHEHGVSFCARICWDEHFAAIQSNLPQLKYAWQILSANFISAHSKLIICEASYRITGERWVFIYRLAASIWSLSSIFVWWRKTSVNCLVFLQDTTPKEINTKGVTVTWPCYLRP